MTGSWRERVAAGRAAERPRVRAAGTNGAALAPRASVTFAPPAPTATSRSAFVPSVSLSRGVALYVGAVLGSGILVLPALAARVAGPGSLLAWAGVTGVSFPIAWMFSQLAAREPDPGGVATWVSRAFGKAAGAVIGWYYFFGVPIAMVVVAMIAASYTAGPFGWDGPALVAVAAGVLATGIGANWIGLRFSAGLQLALSGALAALLVATVVLVFPSVRVARLTPFLPYGWESAGRATALVFWAFFGWEAVAHLAPEFYNPRRDLPRSALMSVAVVGALYCAVALVTVGAAPGVRASADAAPLASLLGAALNVNAGVATAALALLICTGTVNAYVAAASRLGYGLGRDGALPSGLAVLHPRFHTPHRALAAIGCVAAVVLCTTTALHLGLADVMWAANALGIAVYILSAAAGLRLLPPRSTGRTAAAISMAACVAVLPFVGRSMLAPLALAGLCLGYRRLAARRPRASSR